MIAPCGGLCLCLSARRPVQLEQTPASWYFGRKRTTGLYRPRRIRMHLLLSSFRWSCRSERLVKHSTQAQQHWAKFENWKIPVLDTLAVQGTRVETYGYKQDIRTFQIYDISATEVYVSTPVGYLEDIRFLTHTISDKLRCVSQPKFPVQSFFCMISSASALKIEYNII